MRVILISILLSAGLSSLAQNESSNFESFELQTLPECWQVIDEDGDSLNWEVFYEVLDENNNFIQGNTGVGSMTSASFSNSEGVLSPNNFLILPLLDIQPNEDLSYYVGGLDPLFSLENYSVLLSTGDASPEEFTDTLLTETLVTSNFDLREIDLSAYEGMEVFIAFNHHNVSNQFVLRIDDVKYPTTVNECLITTSVEETEVNVSIYPNPVSEKLTVNTSLESEIVITDYSGKTVYQGQTESNNSEIDMSLLANGFYILSVRNAKGVKTERLVVQH